MQNNILRLTFFFALVLLMMPVADSAKGAEKEAVKASAQEIALSASIREREEAIVAKEKELAIREEELAKLSLQVDEKYSKLLALQEEVKVELGVLNQVKDQRFKNLIKVYSAMSASKVAPLLDKMEDKEVVIILEAMKADQVSKIIPKLDQDKAVRVSKSLGLL
ncbi:MAG: hypothetical protein OEY01_07560 [Desulfobulbaceae bacterium]|nr:hypothetical protein [Desulfobulbaceae bacterium]HIJ78911.1 MgtE protein [Deltaproteobacteria bacterium]